ncbi:ArsR family transcriptional regulator [Tenacibaculum holothuriorum]|uniref:ArsR family transcriptional regulator n=1 Tax=Tenacibaculum holothuriorum TaxID=1635173 RepID=A0A1Y2PBJ5_9FLAO|nr:helix-turn-helix transcriptional regulator [Tenacibaculum holothuriorum]OSY87825.1 ArsR family transcriptional regulator [Tenacibaculum holothuriorum]
MDKKQFIEVSKSLTNQTRLKILEWLKKPDENFPPHPTLGHFDFGVCGTFIQKKTEMSQSTISTYLNNMEKCELLISTRKGKWTYFKRNEKTIEDYIEYLK